MINSFDVFNIKGLTVLKRLKDNKDSHNKMDKNVGLTEKYRLLVMEKYIDFAVLIKKFYSKIFSCWIYCDNIGQRQESIKNFYFSDSDNQKTME